MDIEFDYCGIIVILNHAREEERIKKSRACALCRNSKKERKSKEKSKQTKK